jgi:hypothetical protein
MYLDFIQTSFSYYVPFVSLKGYWEMNNAYTTNKQIQFIILSLYDSSKFKARRGWGHAQ